MLAQLEMPLDVIQVDEVTLLALRLLRSMKSLVIVARSVRLCQKHRIHVLGGLAGRIVGLVFQHVRPGLIALGLTVEICQQSFRRILACLFLETNWLQKGKLRLNLTR